MEYLNEFCYVYINDIIIYFKNEEEYIYHVIAILEWLRAAGLQADLKKCEFYMISTKFLRFIIGVDGIATNPKKIEAVRDWQTPTTVKGV